MDAFIWLLQARQQLQGHLSLLLDMWARVADWALLDMLLDIIFNSWPLICCSEFSHHFVDSIAAADLGVVCLLDDVIHQRGGDDYPDPFINANKQLLRDDAEGTF